MVRNKLGQSVKKIPQIKNHYWKNKRNLKLNYHKWYRQKHKEKIKKQNKEYYQRNKEKIKSYSKDYCRKNKEKVNKRKRKYRTKRKEFFNKWYREYYRTPKGRYLSYRQRARDRNISWDLSFENFIKFWQKSCYYCGIKIKTVGLDRINSKKGYTFKNITSCCQICNSMKSNLTRRTFLNKCKIIVERKIKIPK